MAPSVKRRLTPVTYVKQFINAITVIRQQKQIANCERISHYVQRHSDLTEDEIKKYLDSTVHDGFIVEYIAVGVKGQRTGIEQEGYRVPHPEEMEDRDEGHDWYCCECHRPGEVYECSQCFRVYHKHCTAEDTSRTVFTCSICQAARSQSKITPTMLNKMLKFTISRLREKTRDLYKLGHKACEDDFQRFVYKEMDLNLIEQKVQASGYTCVDEFHADVQLIVHNCTLVCGEDKSSLTDLAILVLKESKHELDEMDLCPSCYHMSNAKPDNWFCEPCDPPHEIVYAKQRGYGYWPAKVLEDLNGKYDVRFFGGWHQRAVIPAECVKPIGTDLKTLTVNKTAAFRKSMAELKTYQKKLEARQNATNSENDRESEEDSHNDVQSEESTSMDRDESDRQAYREEGSSSERTRRYRMEKPLTAVQRKRASSQSQRSTAKKRKSSAYLESEEEEEEEEIANGEVTSTSVDRNTRGTFQDHLEEIYGAVTSTGDRISTNQIVTASTGVQASVEPAESTFTQTDEVASSQEDQQQLNEKLWQERMVSTLRSLTKRLEKKFEEEKRLALNELAKQLEDDFEKDKQQAVERTMASMKLEVEKARKAGEDRAREQYMEEMKKLAAKHKDAISQVKRRQWCQQCEKEAVYHCCWNTTYCTVKCQQEHWQTEHKYVCRRRRS